MLNSFFVFLKNDLERAICHNLFDLMVVLIIEAIIAFAIC